MESKAEKREAARQFKERKVPAGAYSVRCPASSEVWVGISRNLDAARNGCWAALRMRAHRVPGLQAAWDSHGEPAFEFEILEAIDEDLHPLAIPDLLKGLKASWLAKLNAQPLL